VVPATSSLADAVDTLHVVSRGGSPLSLRERADLVRRWRQFDDRRSALRARVESLSPREAQVLRMLYEGRTVREIAGILAVSEATVRSQVQAVLRKLDVDSQLAAVAAFSELQEDPEGPRGPG
jgi:RNA polymerase sigma factor (sigma-70 family)